MVLLWAKSGKMDGAVRRPARSVVDRHYAPFGATVKSDSERLVREVQAEGRGEEDRDLPAGHRRIRAEGAGAAPAGDPSRRQGLDEPEERMRGRDVVGEGR